MTGLTTLESIANVVAKSAPLLGTVLGSPLAGVGISLLAQLFGVNPKDTDKLMEAIKNDPDAAIKIKTLAFQHEEALLQLEAQNYSVEVNDRKDARAREVALRDNVPTLLALGFLLNYAAIQFYCVTHANPASDIISARFQDVLIMIISYYFGSSHKEKQQPS